MNFVEIRRLMIFRPVSLEFMMLDHLRIIDNSIVFVWAGKTSNCDILNFNYDPNKICSTTIHIKSGLSFNYNPNKIYSTTSSFRYSGYYIVAIPIHHFKPGSTLKIKSSCWIKHSC